VFRWSRNRILTKCMGFFWLVSFILILTTLQHFVNFIFETVVYQKQNVPQFQNRKTQTSNFVVEVLRTQTFKAPSKVNNLSANARPLLEKNLHRDIPKATRCGSFQRYPWRCCEGGGAVHVPGSAGQSRLPWRREATCQRHTGKLQRKQYRYDQASPEVN